MTSLPSPLSAGRASATPESSSDAAFFAELRTREFARLDATGQAYLDYTGSGLYGASQLTRHHAWLAEQVLGNPHSDNRPSTAANDAVERVRGRIHAFFGTSPETHEIVFTSNASGAMKLVAESFPFTAESRFVMAVDNHNSVGGMRSWARRAGAEITLLPLNAELRLDDPLGHLDRGTAGGRDARSAPGRNSNAAPSLFAYPAQSNFSGVKHSLSLVGEARERGFTVFLDTAAYTPTNPADFAQIGADFCCVSFYKLFGWPTGVGALIARREALALLRRPWYAGGTVDFVSLLSDRHQLRPGAGAFEDGTLDFLGIAALEPGLDLLEGVGMPRLQRRVAALTARLLDELARFGERIVIYGPRSTEARGGTVSFNLLDAEGGVLPYEQIESFGRAANVAIRGGCFCNPGVGEIALGIEPGEMSRCLDDVSDGFSMARLRDCLGPGRAVGALRASLGIASSEDDIDRLGTLIEEVLKAH